MTQIKYAQEIQNPVIKKQFEAFGIKSQKDLEDSVEKQALATMIVLNNKMTIAKAERWQKALKKYNEHNSGQISTARLACELYNGSVVLKSGKIIFKGKAENNPSTYSANVLRTADKFKVNVVEKSAQRAKTSGTNNGELGRVIFMPSFYTKNIKNTKEADIEQLKKLNKISSEKKQALIQAVADGKIAFAGGLTLSEAQSLTEKDADLLLNKLSVLDERLSSSIELSEKRKIAKDMEGEFRADYLTARTFIYNNSNINKLTTGYSTKLGSSEVVDQRLISERRSGVTYAHVRGHNRTAEAKARQYIKDIENGVYRGFGVERDKGVNPYFADGTKIPNNYRVLAECASTVSRDMGTSGQCLTGFKLALEDAGVCKKGDVVYPMGHKHAGKSISQPRDMYLYFDQYPQKFEQVKFIDLGNGKSREITAADIKNLPAGYIGIFIPGEGFENEAGHAFITNGNGQGYSDETDNLEWDNYTSSTNGNGKGEHGTFRIYRLKTD